MKRLFKTLYITSPEIMKLDGEELVIMLEDEEVGRMELRDMEGLFYFGYKPVHPKLMDACAEHGVRISIFHPDGRFISSACRGSYDDSLLRRQQYDAAADSGKCLEIARNTITAKAFNSRWLFGRMYRDYEERIDTNIAKRRAATLKDILRKVLAARDMSSLREVRKIITGEVYSHYDDIIMDQKEAFVFEGRRTKPPVDPVNTLLTFVYEMLEEMCVSALESVGLDAYIGFFHKEKPGRASLALDLMEEFKACLADRFVITMINERVIGMDAFEKDEEGSFILTEDGAATVLEYWQEFTANPIMHPYLEEKVEWRMLPYISATLLARFLCGEIDKYPAFLRKNP